MFKEKNSRAINHDDKEHKKIKLIRKKIRLNILEATRDWHTP